VESDSRKVRDRSCAKRADPTLESCAAELAAGRELNPDQALPNVILGKHTGRLIVKKVHAISKFPSSEKQRDTNHPDTFLFCEATNGTAQFRAASTADLECTVERIAGVLAMQCMVRGQDPKNFQVMVPAEQSLVARLISRAEELLAEGRAIACPASLSARQREVLNAVLCNRANKEIASKLNITVRTVKFHISSLLSKFGVESRTELARRAAGFMRPNPAEDVEIPEPIVASDFKTGKFQTLPMNRALPMNRTYDMVNRSSAVRFPRKTLLA
jgi:DNA-binding CsgD family transcriptional regulator